MASARIPWSARGKPIYSLDNEHRVPDALESFSKETSSIECDVKHMINLQGASIRVAASMVPFKGIPLYVKEPRKADREAISHVEKLASQSRALIWQRTFPVDCDPWNHEHGVDPYAGTDYAQDGPNPSYAFTGEPQLVRTVESITTGNGRDSKAAWSVMGIPSSTRSTIEFRHQLCCRSRTKVELQPSDCRKTKRTVKVSVDGETDALLVKIYEEFPPDHWVTFDEDGVENWLPPAVSRMNPITYKCQSHPGKVINDAFTCCGKSVYSREGCVKHERHEEHPTYNSTIHQELSAKYEFFNLVPNDAGQCDYITISAVFGLNVERQFEIIRLAAIEFLSGCVLIDSLVYPSMDMIHYDTPRTGITKAMMEAAKEAGEILESRHIREILGRLLHPQGHLVLFNGAKLLKALRLSTASSTSRPSHGFIELLHFEWSTGEYKSVWIKPSLKEVTAKRLKRKIGLSPKFRDDPVENAMAMRDLLVFYSKVLGQHNIKNSRDAVWDYRPTRRQETHPKEANLLLTRELQTLSLGLDEDKKEAPYDDWNCQTSQSGHPNSEPRVMPTQTSQSDYWGPPALRGANGYVAANYVSEEFNALYSSYNWERTPGL
ncbi:hypothetical protein N7468_009674 [Penicillium chermesinum]|uniref:Uncharacterized protein n=1 Tax=Penicillium chermesinum TaxID=63820 RepID=A0A9W9NIA2_9EURO|nr:uncharacterized protein N7468_009674 [Penicillium chermesinum]KAJ5220470.1 hypothetical protein N7468_009674 [Penicillium chermesinum]